jgi:uncharacterized protein (DUF2225 family)
MEAIYTVKVQCKMCEISFNSPKVRPSFKKMINKDSDFCGYYKEINPEYYVVRVCPFCGYSTTENFSERITNAQKQVFHERIGSNWTMRDYNGLRNWDDAMHTFKLALVCAQTKEEKPRVIAGILHHIAWLYREKNETELENKFLEFALQAYIDVFETESMDVNNARLMYMIGELHRRLKNYNEAIKWFGRVINDKRIMDSGMIKLCREQWARTREDMLEQNLELPEEMDEKKAR